jgi:hypothetical protein
MTYMNYLVFLETGELEKILSGIKTILLKEFDPSRCGDQPVRPGDSLYFLRDKDEYALRVKANIIRVFLPGNGLTEDLSQPLKELQPRLQLTEDQYNHWSAKKQVLSVEFDCAHKINMIHVAPNKITDRSDWMPFEEFSLIT